MKLLISGSLLLLQILEASAQSLQPDRLKAYEYVVVGSGAGGGPLAARLALAGKRVLLIEAGDDQGANINQTVPVFHAYSTEDESMVWDFWVKHYADEKRARTDSKMTWETKDGYYVGKNPPKDAKMKGMLYPRSGTLGGCTAHNAMVAVYPHASDWSYIANITGDATWAPEKMMSLWEKMEKCEYATPGTPGHGTEGWFSTSKPPTTLAGTDIDVLTMGTTSAGAVSANLKEEEENLNRVMEGDMNNGAATRDKSEGTWLIPLSINTTGAGHRSGSRDFIMSVFNAKGPNGEKKYPLDIALETLATKILFAPSRVGSKPKATGIEFLKGKGLYKADPRSKHLKTRGVKGKADATKEVIIAGGAYNTPQLLKLSGIGPKDELKKFRIPVVKDLPGVGTNLQDHFEIGVTAEKKENFTIVEGCTYNIGNDPCMDKWRKGEGAYGVSNGFVFGIIKKSSVAAQDTVYGNDPDLFLFGGPNGFRGYYPGYSKDSYVFRNWTWVVLKAHSANAAGTVKLTSADPLDTPEITFNYFDTGDKVAGQRDLIAMSEAIDLARKIGDKAMSPADPTSKILTEVLPGPHVKSGSAEMMDYIKAESWSHHASCTAPIGKDGDPMAVLDSKFRVRGVENLRVVDASVFPKVPGWFIAVPTYMISEKAAMSILKGE